MDILFSLFIWSHMQYVLHAPHGFDSTLFYFPIFCCWYVPVRFRCNLGRTMKIASQTNHNNNNELVRPLFSIGDLVQRAYILLLFHLFLFNFSSTTNSTTTTIWRLILLVAISYSRRNLLSQLLLMRLELNALLWHIFHAPIENQSFTFVHNYLFFGEMRRTQANTMHNAHECNANKLNLDIYLHIHLLHTDDKANECFRVRAITFDRKRRKRNLLYFSSSSSSPFGSVQQFTVWRNEMAMNPWTSTTRIKR